jgi:hypothetical protein
MLESLGYWGVRSCGPFCYSLLVPGNNESLRCELQERGMLKMNKRRVYPTFKKIGGSPYLWSSAATVGIGIV